MWSEAAVILRPTLTDGLFWQNGLRLKAYFGLWTEEKYHQDTKGIVKYLWQGHLCPASSFGQDPLQATSLFLCVRKGTQASSRQNLEGCLHGAGFWWSSKCCFLEEQEIHPEGLIQQHGNQSELCVTDSRGSWGRRFPFAHASMQCSLVVVLSVRFWC